MLDRLHDLPVIMRDSGRKAAAYEGAVVDLVETALLAAHVGERFEGVVVDVAEKDPRRGTLAVADPAVEAPLVSTDGGLPLGTEVSAELVTADLETRKVAFRLEG